MSGGVGVSTSGASFASGGLGPNTYGHRVVVAMVPLLLMILNRKLSEVPATLIV